MKTNTQPNKKTILPMSDKSKETIMTIAKEVKGKSLFSEKIEQAKHTLRNLKSLPI